MDIRVSSEIASKSFWRRHGLEIALIVFLLLYFAQSAGYSLVRTWKGSDFDAFYWGAWRCWNRDQAFYTGVSALRRMPLLYPPSAIVLFMPLCWLPYTYMCVIFTAVKLFLLGVLYWGAVRFSGAVPVERVARLACICITVVVAHRLVHSDIGCGQMNIVHWALAAVGVWLMMLTRSWWWAGCLMFSLAVTIKITSLLLLAVPFLHRRWKSVAGTLGFMLLFFFILPRVWFGPEMHKRLTEEFSWRVGDFFMSGKYRGLNVSLNEILLFTLAQCKIKSALKYDNDKQLYYEECNGVKKWIIPPDPIDRQIAYYIWLVMCVVVGGVFLLGRSMLFRAKPKDWTWDLAALSTLHFLLSPLVREAHMVLLIVPTGWIVCHLWARMCAAGGMWAAVKQDRTLALSTLFCAICLLLSEDVAIHLPGLMEPAVRPCLFLAVLGLLFVLSRLVVSTANSGTVSTQLSSQLS